MTLVNTETGEIVESLSVEGARRLTDRIRLLAETLAETLDKLAGLIDDARTGSAWLALGYRSWTDYVSTEFAGVLPRLDREPRQEFVRELTARGMSTRAIAPVVGVNNATVHRDLAGVADATPAKAAPVAEDAAPVEQKSGEAVGDVQPEGEAVSPEMCRPRPLVTGLDGKTYSSPTPATRSAVEQFVNADHAVRLTSWRKNFMAAIHRSGSLMIFTPEDVAEKADSDLFDELVRLSADLDNYIARVRAKRPNRLTALRGGAE